MPPLIMAVAVALEISYAMAMVVVVMAVVTLASVAYSAYMMATMDKPAGADANKRLQTIRSAVQPHRMVYGRCMTGGVLVYAQSHDSTDSSGNVIPNGYITLVVAFTGHQVDAIEEVWLNDKISTDSQFTKYVAAVPAQGYWSRDGGSGGVMAWYQTKPAVPAYKSSFNTITKYLGTSTQTADPLLVSLPPKPTTIVSATPTSGLNDLMVSYADFEHGTTNYGAYTGIGMCVITITVSTAGPTDSFHWVQSKYEGDGTTLDNVASGTLPITAGIQTLVDGVKISFGPVRFDNGFVEASSLHTTGHSLGQSWEIRAFDGAPWAANCTLAGRSYVVVTLENNDTAFPNGLPNIKALIRGNNQIYDPRTGITGYTNNWALCIRDYLVKPYGLGCADSDINDTVSIAAANSCDEAVTLADGTTQTRFALNGSFTVDKTPTAIMNEILATAYGAITWTQGQYRILPAVYYVPDMTFHGMNPNVPGLTESDLRAAIKVRPAPSMKDKFNSVTGTYISTDTWQPVDFPKVVNAQLYLSQDGYDIPKDIQLSYVTNPAQAQRVAKIMLEKGRQGITVDFPAKWSAFPLAVGDNVPISIAYLGWVQKIFTVRDWKMNPDGGVDLQLQEDAVGCYAWNSGEETTVDLAQNTILPDPQFVPTPSGLTIGEELYATNVGSIIKSRAVFTWGPTGAAQYEANYLPPNNTIWAPLPLTTDTTCLVDDTIPGDYSFRVRGMNALGVWGPWATIDYSILGKSGAPSDVTGFGATVTRGQMLLTWAAIPDLDAYGYDIQIGTVWGAIGNTALVSGYAGTSYLWTPPGSGTVHLLIKAIDTTGNYSVNATALTYTISSPGPVASLTQSVIDNIVQLYWSAGTVGSFPVDHYEVWKGNTFATATLLGTKSGTFDIIAESQAGTNKYWIRAIDVVGLASVETGVYAAVNQPPDYVLINNQNLVFSACTLTNAVIEVGQLVLPINNTITWQNHFQVNPDTTLEPWSSPQDQINSGYPIYGQPGPTSALIERVIDCGAIIPSSMLTMNVTRADLAGTVTWTPEILVSSDGSAYTSLGNVYQAAASSFRYVKYRLTASTSNGGL